MTNAEKVRENALRREAKRRGLLLIKSMRRDPKMFDFGRYVLVPVLPENRVRGGSDEVTEMFKRGEGLTLDKVESLFELPADMPIPRQHSTRPTDIAAALRDVQSKYGGYLTESEEQAFVTVRRALASVEEAVKL